jgi:hypothetical protein
MFDLVETSWNRTLSASNVHSIMDKEIILKGTTYTKEKKDSFSESGIFTALKNEETKSEVTVTKETESNFNNDFWNNIIS